MAMGGLGLAGRPRFGGSGLPEADAAMSINQSVRPQPHPGIGLASPSPPPMAAPQAQTQRAPAVAAPMEMPQQQMQQPQQQRQKPLVSFKDNPLGAIGLILSNVAAGMRGQPLPTDQLRAQMRSEEIEQAAIEYKTAEMGMKIFDAGMNILAKAPPAQHATIIADFDKRFSGALGGASIAPMLQAVSDGRIQNAQAKIARATELGIMTPQMLAYYADDPEGLDSILTEIIKEKGKRKTPEELAIEAHATAAGTKAGGKTPAELAADAAAGREPVGDAARRAGAVAAAGREPVGDAAARARATAQASAEGARAGGAGLQAPRHTVDEQKNAQLYARAKAQLPILLGDGTPENPGTFDALGSKSNVVGKLTGAGALQGAEYQRADGALRDIAASYLYSVSGAQAGKEEVNNLVSTVMPSANDAPATKADKRERIQQMVESIRLRTAEGAAGGGGTTNVDDLLEKYK